MPDLTKETYKKIEYTEFFHAWRADSRSDTLDISKQTNFTKAKINIRLFERDIDDPSRTNMLIPGSFPRDISFRIEEICISTRFSNVNHLPDLIRSGQAQLYIGDQPIFPIIFKLIADPERNTVFESKIESTGLPKRVLTRIPLRRAIAIPPRQGVYATFTVAPLLAQKFSEIEEGKRKEFAEIEFILCGRKTELVRASDMEPDELEQARTEAEEHLKRLQELENQYPQGQRWGLSEQEARRILKEQKELRAGFTFVYDHHNIVMRERELEARLKFAIETATSGIHDLSKVADSIDTLKDANDPDVTLAELNDLLDTISHSIAMDLYAHTGIKTDDARVRGEMVEAILKALPKDGQSLSLIGQKLLSEFPEEIAKRLQNDYRKKHLNTTDLDFLREMGSASMEIAEKALKSGPLTLEQTRKIIHDILGINCEDYAEDGWTPTSYLDTYLNK